MNEHRGHLETPWRNLPTVVALTMVLAHATPAHVSRAAEPIDPPWTPHVRALNDALQRKDLGAAARAWRGARQAALGSRRWEGLLEAGDAALRLGEAPAWRATAAAGARELYLAAFFRAREEGSVQGIVRTAAAFNRLGDAQVAEQCLRVARELSAKNAPGRVVTR